MSTGSLPRDWVCANVVPVFERSSRYAPSNQKPISLTLIVAETMECIIQSKLISILESNSLISVLKFGISIIPLLTSF